MKDLPLNGRSFDNLITLNPSAINYTAMKSANTSTSDGNTFSVVGRRPGRQYFPVERHRIYRGQPARRHARRRERGTLGIDAIREFNVLTDTYGAEYGKRDPEPGRGGDAVRHQLPCTDPFSNFSATAPWMSRNIFDQAVVPPFRRNQFGGALGGPLKKNRLFLFGNYEGFRQSLAREQRQRGSRH